MAYGKIFHTKFKGNDGNITYIVEIHKNNYSGNSTEILNLSSDPLVIKHVDQEDTNIQGSEVKFSIVAIRSEYNNYDEILSANEYTYKLIIAYDPYPEYPRWTGYILPSECSRGYFEDITIYSFTAIDCLSKLKYYAFSTDLTTGNVTKSRKTALDVVGNCLNKINGFGGDIYCQSGIECAYFGDGPGIGVAYIHPSNFTRKNNGLIVPDNCYEVCDNVLKAFNLRICSPFLGTWIAYDKVYQFIIRDLNETTSSIYKCVNDGNGNFDWGLYGYVNQCLRNIDDFTFLPESELTKLLPIKSIELIQHNYDNGVIVGSTDFNDMDNSSIWTLSDVTVSQTGEVNTFNIDAATTAEITTTNSYQLENTEGNAYIRVSFILKNKEQASVLPLYVKINVINTTTGEVKTDVLPLIAELQRYRFDSHPHSMYLIKHNCYYKFELSITNASLLYDMDFEITNFVIAKYYAIDGQFTENVLWDYLYEAYSENYTLPAKTIETRIGDSDVVSNKSSVTYTDDDAYLTSDWNRNGVEESKSLQEIILQNYFNRFGGDRTILKLKIYDPADIINLENTIQFDGNTYEILDYEKSFKSGFISLRLGKISTSDVSVTIFRKEIPNTTSTGTSSSAVATNNGSNVGNNLAGLYALLNAQVVPITTGTTIDSTYSGKIIECSGTFTVTLPNGMVTGMRVDIVNVGTGTITIAASTTLQSDSSKTKLATKYTGASCYHRGSNVWLVVGKLTS